MKKTRSSQISGVMISHHNKVSLQIVSSKNGVTQCRPPPLPPSNVTGEYVILLDHVIDWNNSQVLKTENNFSKKINCQILVYSFQAKSNKSCRW